MKDPAFLFYSNDFSIGTQFLSDEQVGKYVRLLLAQHQHGHLTEKQMLFICKSYDFDIVSKYKKDDNGITSLGLTKILDSALTKQLTNLQLSKYFLI